MSEIKQKQQTNYTSWQWYSPKNHFLFCYGNILLYDKK